MKYHFAQFLREHRIDPESVPRPIARSAVYRAWFVEARRRSRVEQVAKFARRLVRANAVPPSVFSEIAMLAPGSPESRAFIAANKQLLSTNAIRH